MSTCKVFLLILTLAGLVSMAAAQPVPPQPAAPSASTAAATSVQAASTQEASAQAVSTPEGATAPAETSVQAASAQTSAAPASPQALPMQVHLVNFCAPPEGDVAELRAALALIPLQPVFDVDREVARGWTTAADPVPPAEGGKPRKVTTRWVRLRRDFPESAPLLSAQYSYSPVTGGEGETLVLYFRQGGGNKVLQLAISSAQKSGGGTVPFFRQPSQSSRVTLERFGQSSITLARCHGTQASKSSELMERADKILAAYKAALGAAATIPGELMRLGSNPGAPASATAAKH